MQNFTDFVILYIKKQLSFSDPESSDKSSYFRESGLCPKNSSTAESKHSKPIAVLEVRI